MRINQIRIFFWQNGLKQPQCLLRPSILTSPARPLKALKMLSSMVLKVKLGTASTMRMRTNMRTNDSKAAWQLYIT